MNLPEIPRFRRSMIVSVVTITRQPMMAHLTFVGFSAPAGFMGCVQTQEIGCRERQVRRTRRRTVIQECPATCCRSYWPLFISEDEIKYPLIRIYVPQQTCPQTTQIR